MDLSKRAFLREFPNSVKLSVSTQNPYAEVVCLVSSDFAERLAHRSLWNCWRLFATCLPPDCLYSRCPWTSVTQVDWFESLSTGSPCAVFDFSWVLCTELYIWERNLPACVEQPANLKCAGGLWLCFLWSQSMYECDLSCCYHSAQTGARGLSLLRQRVRGCGELYQANKRPVSGQLAGLMAARRLAYLLHVRVISNTFSPRTTERKFLYPQLRG